MFKAKRLSEDDVYDVLTQIIDRQSIQGLQISDNGDVLFMIEVDASQGKAMEPLRHRAEKAVRDVKGVSKVTAILTAERKEDSRVQNATKSDPHGMEKNPKLTIAARKIIAVSSGKGGVGKSTVAAGLARALAGSGGKRIGILDADIYGPSQPTLFGLKAFKPSFTDEKKIIPADVDGIKIMSIGFMVDAEKALVWRGPMVQSAIYQMFRDVEWADGDEPLDVLIVDMPPGTGDAQLTLAQKVDVDGAVPILGLIENMSTHVCSSCGHEEHIFGHGGAKDEADKLKIPFLGEIPLSAGIRAKADAGESYELPDSITSALT